MVIFCQSKEFFVNYCMFNQEAFKRGYDLGKLECRTQVTNHHLGLDLAFLEEESNGEPFLELEVTTPIVVHKAPSIEPTTMTKASLTELVDMSEPTSADPATWPEPPFIEDIVAPF